jgi:hypothetical protein
MTILVASLLFIVVAAATWWFGLWSNLITLVNLLLSGLIASSVYQNVADQINEFQPSFALLVDFISVWLVFILSFMVLRSITDTLSGYRMVFHPLVEMSGRTILSLWIAGVFVCFTFFTLQLAPLDRDFFGDKSADPREVPGTLFDRSWLAFIHSRSRGALSSSQKENLLFPEYKIRLHPDDEGLDARVFDPRALFLNGAKFRRRTIESRETLRITSGS